MFWGQGYIFKNFQNRRGSCVFKGLQAPMMLANSLLNNLGSCLQGGPKRSKCPRLYKFLLLVEAYYKDWNCYCKLHELTVTIWIYEDIWFLRTYCLRPFFNLLNLKILKLHHFIFHILNIKVDHIKSKSLTVQTFKGSFIATYKIEMSKATFSAQHSVYKVVVLT